MNSIFEKEKKLNEAINKLNSLDFNNPIMLEKIDNLKEQKNQLEIEKKDLEDKYFILKDEYEKLKIKISVLND